jgi:hypothetical protein
MAREACERLVRGRSALCPSGIFWWRSFAIRLESAKRSALSYAPSVIEELIGECLLASLCVNPQDGFGT